MSNSYCNESFKVRDNVYLRDFSVQTRAPLKKIGFTETDNISELFSNYLKENSYDINLDLKEEQ